MSFASKIAIIVVVIAIQAVFLLKVRRPAEYRDMVKIDHITAAFFLGLAGFAFASGLGLLYNIIFGCLVGWGLGFRWAHMRIKRSRSTYDTSAREHSLWVHLPSGLRMPIHMKENILPLPFMLDCLIAVACVALGVLFGWGARVIICL